MRADHGTSRRVLDVASNLAGPGTEQAWPDAAGEPGGAGWSGDRARLLAEFVGLFLVVPTLPALGLLPVTIIPVLVAFGVLCLAVLLCDPRFPRHRLGLGPLGRRPGGLRATLRRIGAWFLLGAAAMGAAVAVFDAGALFSLVRERPHIWAIIMVGYPLLSVYPQEMIFRTFMFHRYGGVFRTRTAMVAASAAAFGYAHIVLGNAVAVALSLAGGFLFAYTYDRTRSTLLCAVEHALYGCFIFTIGLGAYFYHGSMRMAEMATGGP